MGAPYFDRKAFLEVLPQHAVDALETAFNRSGGSSTIILDQAEIEVLLNGARNTARMARENKTDIEELQSHLMMVERIAKK